MLHGDTFNYNGTHWWGEHWQCTHTVGVTLGHTLWCWCGPGLVLQYKCIVLHWVTHCGGGVGVGVGTLVLLYSITVVMFIVDMMRQSSQTFIMKFGEQSNIMRT